jgi:hypothetical protein
MVPRGLFAVGNSLLKDSVSYHFTLYRANDGCKAYSVRRECGSEENAEPVIEPRRMTAMRSARRLAETHHEQPHCLNARKLAAREQEEAMQCSK